MLMESRLMGVNSRSAATCRVSTWPTGFIKRWNKWVDVETNNNNYELNYERSEYEFTLHWSEEEERGRCVYCRVLCRQIILELRKEADYVIPFWIILGSSLGGLLLLALLVLALWKVHTHGRWHHLYQYLLIVVMLSCAVVFKPPATSFRCRRKAHARQQAELRHVKTNKD